jgi:penicillin-binding protein 1A
VEGAFVALDPTTGAIKAMVGGYDFKRSEFNRATLSRRQPGSAFKPIIYATAVEMGFSPSTMMVDSPIIYTDPQTQKVWKPENYESKFYGLISMRDALVHSRNVATVRLLEKIGVKNVIGFARRVGIQSALSSDLSLALGSSGVSLLELTAAISVFGNQGVRAEPRMIASIKDHNGVVLESHEVQQQQVISRETAYIVTNMMEDVIHRGTARAARGMGRPLAGKTGTTNDFSDAWFIGYSPNLAAGVWVGFDDLRSLGDREAGGTVALPIWMGFMNDVLPSLPPASFPIPEDIVYAKIDPRTGELAPADEEGAIVDIFVKGTEPKKSAVLSPQPVQFFKADEPNDQEG